MLKRRQEMKYQQFRHEERYMLSALRKTRISVAEIARLLGRHRSTIYREIKRNAKPCDGGYRAPEACQRANGRRSRSRKKSQFNENQWEAIEYLIAFEWSPEQIAHVLKKHKLFSISHETIYRYIGKDRKYGGDLYKNLRQANKKRRKKHNSCDSRGVLRGKRPLEDRPGEAQERLERGHYEIDLMHGTEHSDCILTLVDRTTRYLIIRKLRNKTMNEVKIKLVPIIRKYGIKTITADNGTEWHAFKDIEQLTGVKFYFAKPYHSWERGTNENTNGLIRQYIPKKVSMKKVDQYYCNRVMKRLNRRPRKILQYDCPETLHSGFNFVALLS